MNPMSAVAFVLAGLSLALVLPTLHDEKQKFRTLVLAARLCASAVALIGLVKVVGILFDWNGGVDRWLFASKLADGPSFPDRMTSTTALNLLLLGTALLLVGVRNQSIRFGVEFAVVIVGFGSLLDVLGYAYEFAAFYGHSVSASMPLPAGAACLSLSIAFFITCTTNGLFLLFDKNAASGTMTRGLLAAGIFGPVVFGWLTRKGEAVGIYGGAFGEAAEAIGNIILIVSLVFWSAKRLVLSDLKRKTAEDSVRENEERFASAFEYAPIGVALVAPDGRWLKVNQALCALVGYSEAELIARTFHDVIHPDERGICREKSRGMMAGEINTFQVESRCIHVRGHVVTILLSGSLVRDSHDEPSYYVTQIQDISERKRVEVALLESKRFLQSTLDALTAHIAILDEHGTIIEVNDAWNRFRGENTLVGNRRANEGDNYLAVCDAASGEFSDEAPALASGIRAVMAGEKDEFQLEYPCHRPGEPLWFMVRVTRFEVDGSARAVIAHENITPRKRAEEELRWKTAFLEAQVDSSFDGILVVDPHRKKILQNQRFNELLKIPQQIADDKDDEKQIRWVTSLVKEPKIFFDKVAYLYGHPDEKSQDEIELTDGMVFDRYSAPVLGEQGEYYGRIWTFHDITERRKMLASLRESEARYQRIAANVPGMVYQRLLRPDGSITYPFVSEGCREVLGVDPQEFQHDPLALLATVHAEDREDFSRSVQATANSLVPWSWQGRVVRPDTGEIRCIHGVSRPERQANGDIVWDGVLMDVTERKQAEEDRRAKHEAERANHAKSKFLSRVSHELRTPLNAILGFGQVLEFSKLPEQEAIALGYILKGGRHLLSLIDEVLDLSRAETGELHLMLGNVDFGQVAQECVGLMAKLAEASDITCRVKVSKQDQAILWADDLRVRQILLNLLSNAIKYNRAGGRVFVDYETVPGDRLRLKVTDTGSGISPEGIARLFVPFERLEQDFGEVEGTGLGLVVSQRLAEAMDGTLGVESEVGRGSTFWFELPLAPSAAKRLPLDFHHLDDLSDPAMIKPHDATLLYIEDNASNLQVVQLLTAKLRPGWRFLSARDGKTGLDQARQTRPNIILLDFQLPGIQGDEVLAELRRDPSTRHIPVIVLSADATTSNHEGLRANEVDGYMSKPFVAEQLLGLLDETLRKAAPARKDAPASQSRHAVAP